VGVVGSAGAHVTVRPPALEDGEIAMVTFQMPNERNRHATVQVAITAPAGIDFVSAKAPRGWQVEVEGRTAVWSGGRIVGRSTASFPARARVRTRAGGYAFAATQRYDDGVVVRWQAAIRVLPATGRAAPSEHLLPAIVAAAVGILVLALSVLLARRFRRRALQER
jgi:uncharacterized protein YcnI